MGINAPRSGEPVNLNSGSYVTTAGTAGASARVIQTGQGAFASYARPVVVQNLDGTNAVFLKINDNDASSTDCQIRLGANERVKIDWVNVEILSAYMAAGVYTTLMVHGWVKA